MDQIYYLLFIGLGFVAVILIRSYYYRGYLKGRESKLYSKKDFNVLEECDRFRRLILKLHELQIIELDEHYKIDNASVYLNIRDLYPIYRNHYPMYFPSDAIPDYDLLLEILSQDHGYSGATNLWFEKAAYRPAIELKRFIEQMSKSPEAKA
jgi:hypothetical protein